MIVSWTAPSGLVANYHVYYRNAKSCTAPWLSVDTCETQTIIHISNVEPHVNYEVQVAAEAPDGTQGLVSEIVICNKMTKAGNPL